MTDDLRERAEKIGDDLGVTDRFPQDDYADVIDLIESALRSVRDEALEEAAKVAESNIEEFGRRGNVTNSAKDIAQRIRALKEAKP